MNRRDFLLFRTEGNARILEMSCQALYLYFTDAVGTEPGMHDEQGRLQGADWWSGEPALDIRPHNGDRLLLDLVADLENVDVLRLLDTQWLVQADFVQQITRLVEHFRAGGGEVEYVPGQLEQQG